MNRCSYIQYTGILVRGILLFFKSEVRFLVIAGKPCRLLIFYQFLEENSIPLICGLTVSEIEIPFLLSFLFCISFPCEGYCFVVS